MYQTPYSLMETDAMEDFDVNLLMEFVSHASYNYSGLPDSYKSNEAIAFIAAEHWGDLLQHMPPECQANKRIALAALASSSMAIRWVAAELQEDEDPKALVRL